MSEENAMRMTEDSTFLHLDHEKGTVRQEKPGELMTWEMLAREHGWTPPEERRELKSDRDTWKNAAHYWADRYKNRAVAFSEPLPDPPSDIEAEAQAQALHDLDAYNRTLAGVPGREPTWDEYARAAGWTPPEEQPRWIPVTERLPTVGVFVWVGNTHGGQTTACRRRDGSWYDRNNEEWLVTHWQPLPDPPGETEWTLRDEMAEHERDRHDIDTDPGIAAQPNAGDLQSPPVTNRWISDTVAEMGDPSLCGCGPGTTTPPEGGEEPKLHWPSPPVQKVLSLQPSPTRAELKRDICYMLSDVCVDPERVVGIMTDCPVLFRLLLNMPRDESGGSAADATEKSKVTNCALRS